HAMRYTTYRGLNQVTNWVRLKFAAMNLKKMAMWKFKNEDFHDFYVFLFNLFQIFNNTDRKPCLA
ncbi:MAG: IS5/IS1182 family transposase, partial [Ruminococcaceae bacterium]|nr:IS5/IS1182 family transposase [Oscillospiraceae bacterium]